MDYVPHRRIDMRRELSVSERWLHEQLLADPTLLGLGEVDVKDSERRQAAGGRLDLLLHDPETNTRYEVELQLGPTDESHIIRTIEYWDHERRRYPQYEHVAVIVAEDITARFFNRHQSVERTDPDHRDPGPAPRGWRDADTGLHQGA